MIPEFPEETRPYQPYGTALQLIQCRDSEVLFTGPAGTGKTRAWLEKLFAIASKYPNSRQLIIRKTRASLTESALVTWEQKVVPEGHPCLLGPERAHRLSYVFPNGSRISVGGMDNATRILSTEYDLIYVPEAIELTEAEWETLKTRLRNNRVPYQQIGGDTNPYSPRHWLYLRGKGDKLRFIESRHEDNPTLFDPVTGQMTTFGAAYLAALDSLSGVLYLRYRLGRWVQAEGVVYEEFDPAIHTLTFEELTAKYPKWRDWPTLWGEDFGYTNPFVWQEWALDPDGRLVRLREIYKTQTLVEDHARTVKALPDLKTPTAQVCDHDAEDRATLERHLGIRTTPAYKGVTDGIQAVKARLRPAGDGEPRLFFVSDGLVERDEALALNKKPTSTIEEFDSYIWDLSANRKKGEEPKKENDHGLDATRYIVAHVDNISAGMRSWAEDPAVLAALAARMKGT